MTSPDWAVWNFGDEEDCGGALTLSALVVWGEVTARDTSVLVAAGTMVLVSLGTFSLFSSE